MGIVLNEVEWAKDMIQERELGKNPFETLTRVAKYYIYNNYSKKDVRNMLDIFLIQCDPTASLPRWSDTLDKALQKAQHKAPIQIDHISITKPEMDLIGALEGKQMQRLAFTLLCLAKYRNLTSGNNYSWVTNDDSEIMKLANIRTSVKRQALLYYNLRQAGLLKFSKKIDNTSVRVNYIKGEDEVLQVTDFRNLGYQYLKYCGEPYFECQNCGIVTKYDTDGVTKGRKQKYCKSCASEIKIQQNVNSVMRGRGNSYMINKFVRG